MTFVTAICAEVWGLSRVDQNARQVDAHRNPEDTRKKGQPNSVLLVTPVSVSSSLRRE